MMKKAIGIIVLALSLVSLCALTGCGREDGLPISPPVTPHTDERLIAHLYDGYEISETDWYMPDDFGIPLESGEMWHQTQLKSAATEAEAYNEVVSFGLMQNPASYTAVYIGENNYYYQYKLAYESAYSGYTYTYRVIVYKDSVKSCSFNNKTGYTLKIRDLTAATVTDLLDLETFFYCDRWLSATAGSRELIETTGTFVYTWYLSYISYGDWGVSDTAYLEKRTFVVDKTTGLIVTLPAETVKTVTLPDE